MTRPILALTLTAALAACGPRVVVSTPPAACAALVPQSWKQGVEGAPVPQMDARIAGWIGKPLTDAMVVAITGPWASGYVQAEGRVAKANGRTVDAIGIVERCEALVNAAHMGQPD